MSLAPTAMSCRFKRQIKLFEKLMSQVLSGQKLPQKDCPFERAEDIPTFFFGNHKEHSAAEIEDDSHFENLADTIEKYSKPTTSDF